MEAAVTPMPDKIRVLIADDHRMFAEALEAILLTDKRLEIAGHAGDGSTPCLSRLSPVTRRRWIRARASSLVIFGKKE